MSNTQIQKYVFIFSSGEFKSHEGVLEDHHFNAMEDGEVEIINVTDPDNILEVHSAKRSTPMAVSDSEDFSDYLEDEDEDDEE